MMDKSHWMMSLSCSIFIFFIPPKTAGHAPPSLRLPNRVDHLSGSWKSKWLWNILETTSQGSTSLCSCTSPFAGVTPGDPNMRAHRVARRLSNTPELLSNHLTAMSPSTDNAWLGEPHCCIREFGLRSSFLWLDVRGVALRESRVLLSSAQSLPAEYP